MKTNMKIKCILAVAVIATTTHSSASTYYINNAINGTVADVLFQDSNGDLLDGGVIAIGHFSGGLPSTSLSDIASIASAFTSVTSLLAGSNSVDLGGSFPGYAQLAGGLPNGHFQGPTILGADPLIGNLVYLFAGNGANLGVFDATLNPTGSTAWALGSIATYSSDDPFEQSYVASPSGATLVGDIGSIGTFTGDSGVANGSFTTLQLSAVPEPSSLLLSAFGAFALLRRKR